MPVTVRSLGSPAGNGLGGGVGADRRVRSGWEYAYGTFWIDAVADREEEKVAALLGRSEGGPAAR